MRYDADLLVSANGVDAVGSTDVLSVKPRRCVSGGYVHIQRGFMLRSFRAWCPRCMMHQLATENDDHSVECDSCGHLWNGPEIPQEGTADPDRVTA